MNPNVQIVDCCECCKRPHRFNRNKRQGMCLELMAHGASEKEARITRFTKCHFFLRDIGLYKKMRKEI